MLLAMLLLVGLFDMSLWGVVDIFCTSMAHHLDVPLLSSLLESMCDEWFLFSQSHSCIELFAASHLDVECLKLLAPLLDVYSLREPTFSVVLFGTHAAKRVGFKLAIFAQLGGKSRGRL